MKKIFNLFIIHMIILKYAISYLIYPFKTRQSQIKNTDKNITLLFRSLVDNHIFITIEIGDPKQTVEIFLRSDSYDFYLSDKTKNDINTNSSNPYMFDVNSDLNCFYDKNESYSYEITNKSKLDFKAGDHRGNISYDYIYFTTNLNQSLKAKFPFILYNTTLGNIPGVMGIKAVKHQTQKEYNFIDKLKLNDIINSYFWMINYTSDYEGNFIIGEQPHIFDPTNYNEEKLFTSYPFLNNGFNDWGLIFNEIMFKGRNFRPYHECYFRYELNYIKGIHDIEKELDIYFNESIQNKTCFKEDGFYPYSPRRFFYCDKDKYKDNIKYFPPIEFYHKDLNYTFEMNYKDLFIEKHDKLILMIFFDEYSLHWDLGKPFLRKYSFLMNQDSKILGFYHKKSINDDNEHYDNIINNQNDNNFILKIFLICIGIIVFLMIGIFIGIYLFKDKKKRINTIDDDYDYTAKNEEIN